MKIKDRILLGIITGVVAGVPGRLFNTEEYYKGLTDMKYGQMAARLVLPKGKVNKPGGRVIGSIINQMNLGLTGVIVTYVLAATGRDKAIIKGMGVTSVAWMVIYGLTSRLNVTAGNKKPIAHILSLFDHLFLGGLSGFIAARLGHDSLFPDKEKIVAEDEKLPLMGGTEGQVSDPSEKYVH